MISTKKIHCKLFLLEKWIEKDFYDKNSWKSFYSYFKILWEIIFIKKMHLK